MDLVEVRVDVRTQMETRQKSVEFFGSPILLGFSQGQLLSVTVLPPVRPAGCRTGFECTELKFIFLKERILDQAELCAGSSSLGILSLTVSIDMS